MHHERGLHLTGKLLLLIAAVFALIAFAAIPAIGAPQETSIKDVPTTGATPPAAMKAGVGPAATSNATMSHGNSPSPDNRIEAAQSPQDTGSTPAGIGGVVKPAAGSTSLFLRANPYQPQKKHRVRQVQKKASTTNALPWEVQPEPLPPDPLAGLDENQRRAYVIEALHREIREKQRRADLLMRLFVIDEKDYLIGIDRWKDHGGKLRVDYEAAELRANVRELAKLQKNLQSMQKEQDRP
jgi:hypothetical protein